MQSSQWFKTQISNCTLNDLLTKYKNEIDIVPKKNVWLNNLKFKKVYKKWILKHLCAVLVLD